MKVKIVKPREYWISPYTFLRTITLGIYEPSIKVCDALEPVSRFFQKFCKSLSPKDKIVIHDYDLWNFDYSLAKVILPALLRIREDKSGTPFVDDQDVPEEIRSTTIKENGLNIDEFFHDRWAFVIGEMIFAFENILNDKCEFNLTGEDQKRIENGLILFGKYYQCLWN